MDSRPWPCPTCEDVRDFEQPLCVDGHTDDGGECPEWACADCGTALLIGDAPVAAASPRLRRAA